MSAAVRPLAIATLAAAAALPLVLGQGGALMEHAILAAAYVVMALGLNVVVGFAGLLDLGYVAFFAIGAHVAAYLGSAFWGVHLDFLAVLAFTILATTAAGVLIGVPTLRLRGDYVGVVTLAFGEIIAQVVNNGGDIHIFGSALTGGPQGISALDRIDLPFLAPFSALDLRPWYWFALTLVVLTLLACLALRDSRIGRAWIALRDDEAAAAAAGVPIVRAKLTAYAVGGALGRRLRRLHGVVPGHGQPDPVHLLVLDLHPRDGRARRARLGLGRDDRGGRALGDQQLAAARRALRRAGQARAGLRPLADLRRHPSPSRRCRWAASGRSGRCASGWRSCATPSGRCRRDGAR